MNKKGRVFLIHLKKISPPIKDTIDPIDKQLQNNHIELRIRILTRYKETHS